MHIRFEASTFTIRKKYSGVGYYSKSLALSLKKQNHVDLFSGPIKSTGGLQNLINRTYGKLASYGLALPYDMLWKKVDLTIFPNFSIWPTVRSKVKATVIHDLTYLHHPELVEKKNLAHLRRCVSRSIKKSDFIITVSESVKNELISTFQINQDNIVVTTIPPRENFFVKSAEDIVKKYELPLKKYVLFIGNQEPRKNLTLLLNAFLLLPDDIKKEYCLVLGGGSGWNSDEFEKRLSEAMRSGVSIKRMGYIPDEDLPGFYQQASLFVMPSIYEGFGMPILEAMASGTPVISSDIKVLHEAAGDAALYIDPFNVDDLKEKIQYVLTNKNMSDSLVAKGHKNLKRFSWKNNVETITQKVQSLTK